MQPEVIIVLFDGYCVLCSHFAQRLIKCLGNKVRLIPMQSPEGQKELLHYHLSQAPNEVVIIKNKKAIMGVEAVTELMKMSKGICQLAGRIIQLLPVSFSQRIYRLVARHRYRLFGHRSRCYLPPKN
ncbi:thiol-disulfide oxidoreductase DCC family protein [Geofilum sp. OHC36d9]|uniref:thiol-disulfide oxidoreductase DCC family protein n=1 Tax=Geofilum sp. OHC36d9 TaxID=3458413 RepID=UPI0040348B29